jgi:hypothetical protein
VAAAAGEARAREALDAGMATGDELAELAGEPERLIGV